MVWLFLIACVKTPSSTSGAIVLDEVQDPCVRACLADRDVPDPTLAMMECTNECAIRASITESATTETR